MFPEQRVLEKGKDKETTHNAFNQIRYDLGDM